MVTCRVALIIQKDFLKNQLFLLLIDTVILVYRHRLGANWDQIPVNCPYRARVKNMQRDGPMNVSGNQHGAPNYFPNSFSGPTADK